MSKTVRVSLWGTTLGYLTYAYDPMGRWTREHQTFLNGKKDGFEYGNLEAFGLFCNLEPKEIKDAISQIRDAFLSFSPWLRKRVWIQI